MKVYNESKTEILEEYDLEQGKLIDDVIIIHHDAVKEVKEEGHYKTVAEYPNGGRDVEWVIDVPGVEASEAYDEEEKIQVYIPYTEEEIAEQKAIIEQQKKEEEIANYIKLLSDTDYQALKYAEGWLTEEEYADIKAEREEWRNAIRKLRGE